MRSTERLKILHNLVMQGKGDVIEKVVACKGDFEKEVKILEKYK